MRLTFKMFDHIETKNLAKFIVRFVGAFVLIAVLVNDNHNRNECCEEYCYDQDHIKPQQAQFSSKTSYFTKRGQPTDEQFIVPNCNPVKIWLYVRHGARLPKAHKEMKRLRHLEFLRDEIIANYEKRNTQPERGAMCESDLNLLKKWQWDHNITEEYDEFLAVQGWKEVKSLATRYHQLFPNIMGNVFDEHKFLFRHTDAQRTKASFKAYVEGLFGANAHKSIEVRPIDETVRLLKPYTFCPTNKEQVTGNNSEYRKYMQSPIMTKLVSDVSQRLGFNDSLDIKEVFSMYHMCLYDQAWHVDETSAWCSVFTPSQFFELEYPEDVRKYYECGYGGKNNERRLCGLMNDMINHIDSKEQPNAVAYFTHSSSLLLLLTSLKAFKDSKPLRADNYNSMSRRKWRLSELAPFAANIAVVKYNCPNDSESDKVKFFLNEQPLLFEGCDKGLCDLKNVKERYKDFLQADCNEYFCSSPETTCFSTVTKVLFTIATILAVVLKFQLH